MHGSRYWTDGDWEYTFLVPQDTIDGNYTGKIHNVLKEFGKTLYVRSDSDSSGWEEVQKTAEMPELENGYGKTGWTLSSEQNILSDKGMLDKLAGNLKETGCSCSFMVINDEPEQATNGNSAVDLEAEDSGQPPLGETTHETANVAARSEKKRKKKKQKSKKSNKVKVGNGTQTRTLNRLKDWKKSKKASEAHKLTPYKVISDTNNDENNVKEAWKKIGHFIKSQAKIYKNVKPIGYVNRKHWHNWHKSWVGKVFVQEDETRFWLMKLNADLKEMLQSQLETHGFNIEKCDDADTAKLLLLQPTLQTPTAETPSKQKPKIASDETKEYETTAPKPANVRPDHREMSSQNNTSGLERRPIKPMSGDAEVALQDAMREVVKQTEEQNRQEISRGDANHFIANLLTHLGNGEFILGLKLTKPGENVLGKMNDSLCDGYIVASLVSDINDANGLDATQWLEPQDYESKMLSTTVGKLGWMLKIRSDLGEAGPSEDEIETLEQMSNYITKKGLELVKLNSDGTIAGSKPPPDDEDNPQPKKDPPPLPQRKVKTAPVPKGFATLDSLKPKTNNQHVKTLVLVKYDDITSAKKLGMDYRTKLSKSTRKYGAFNVNKANKTLSEFKNGTLIGANGMKTDKNYRNVLENPVVDNYKNDTLYNVKLWNLEIPEDTTDETITKLRDELAKCGIAIRKDWRKSKV